MTNKVVLILVDGMRPDGIIQSGSEIAGRLIDESLVSMHATTVMPSVTLPCHMSLFHSVEPMRHGILTNTYVPQVRPINGICEAFKNAGKTCAMFYNWEELKDLARPGSLVYANYISQYHFGYEESNLMLAKNAAAFIPEVKPDFTFIYLGAVDETGHHYGWMTDEYLSVVRSSFECIEIVKNSLPDDYVLIVTADHGGHDRGHGSDMPEDMTIPVIINGKDIAPGELDAANIIDLAPTAAKLAGVQPDRDWEGKSLL